MSNFFTAILVLGLSAHASAGRSYVAAVYEHSRIGVFDNEAIPSRAAAIAKIKPNLDVYEKQARLAKGKVISTIQHSL